MSSRVSAIALTYEIAKHNKTSLGLDVVHAVKTTVPHSNIHLAIQSMAIRRVKRPAMS